MTLDRLVRLTVDDYDLAAERSRAKERRVAEHVPGTQEVAGLFVHDDEGLHLDSAAAAGNRLFGDRGIAPLEAAKDARTITAELERLLTRELRRAFPQRALDSFHWCADANRARTLALAELRRRKRSSLEEDFGSEGLQERLRTLGLDPDCFLPTVLELERTSTPLDDAGKLVLPAAESTQEELFDPRSLDELAAAGAVVENGRVEDRIVLSLCAGVIADVLATGSSRLESCAALGLPIVLDECVTFGRTGTTFAGEALDLEPALLVLGTGSGPGLLVSEGDSGTKAAEEELPADPRALSALRQDWCRLLADRDPVFEGRSFAENLRIKGEYLRAALVEISLRHPDLLVDLRGRGGAFRVLVRQRETLVREAWRRGLRLRPVGPAGEESELEVLLPADVRTREIDVLWEALDRLFAVLSTQESLLSEGRGPDPRGIGD